MSTVYNLIRHVTYCVCINYYSYFGDITSHMFHKNLCHHCVSFTTIAVVCSATHTFYGLGCILGGV